MGFVLADGSVHTDYRVGDTFIRTKDSIINKGTVVTVTCKDFNTPCPLVTHGDGKENFSNWGYLTPTPETLRKARQRKGFTKSDLKDGMVVTLRDGRQGIVFGGYIERTFRDIKSAGTFNPFIAISDYNENLTDLDDYSAFDIMKVEYMGETIWQREPEQCPKQKQLDELYKRIDELKAKADMIKGG